MGLHLNTAVKMNTIINAVKMLHGKRILAKALSISILNQIVSSGTSFVLSIYLVNILTTKEFGIYGIMFAIILVYSNIANSSITIQMVANFPQGNKNKQLEYGKKVFHILLIFYAFSILVLSISSYAIFSSLSVFEGDFLYVILMGIASLSISVKEFFVRLAFSRRREMYALLINSIALISVLSMITVERHFLSDIFSPQKAIILLSTSNIIASIIGFYSLELHKIKVTFQLILLEVKKLWTGGKWSALYGFIYNLRAQAHTLIVALVFGPSAIGMLNASRIFVTPVIMVSPAISQVMVPRLVTKENYRLGSSLRYGFLISIFQFYIVVFYMAIVLLLYDSILNLFFPEDMPEMKALVFAWGVFASMLALRNGMEITLVAQRLFKKQMKIATLTLPISLLLISISINYGLDIVIYCLATIEGIHVMLILASLFKNKYKQMERKI